MKSLRMPLDFMLDIILSSMSIEESVKFLSIFISKVEEGLKEMSDQLDV